MVNQKFIDLLSQSNLVNFTKERIICTSYEWESHIDNIFRIINLNLKQFEPDNLLDVGCCDGDRTIRLANYFKINLANVCGIDFEKNYLKACRKKINTVKVDLERNNIPFAQNTFDLVVCNQVLEHLKNYQNVVTNMIRVTKTGGYIVLGIPNLAHLINRIYLVFGRQPMCIDINSSHVRAFTHRSFVLKLSSIKSVKLLDYKGSLMYPFPFFIGKLLCRYLVGLSGYVCYLLQKV